RLGSLRLSALAGRPLAAGLLTFGGGVLLVAWDVPLFVSLPFAGLGYINLLLLTGALSWKELMAVKDMYLRPKETLTAA
ncbi:MAG: hypothetical protein WAU47_15135, partial [Desulfobaccales bacterium]